MHCNFRPYSFALSTITGLALGGAALIPQTYFAVVLATLASLGLIKLSQTQVPLKFFFWIGIIFHCLAFYWLTEALRQFGGFPTLIAYLLFGLFVVSASTQFLFVGWLTKFATFPWAWLCGELLFPRLFPWSLAHNFFSWSSFSGLAEICGVSLLSFILLTALSTIIGVCFKINNKQKPVAKKDLLTISAFGILILIGFLLNQRTTNQLLSHATTVKIGLIQGNHNAWEGANPAFLTGNLADYYRLSSEAISQGAKLLIWPESIMNAWTPEAANQQIIDNPRYDPLLGKKFAVPLIYGGLTYSLQNTDTNNIKDPSQQKALFNSAIFLSPAKQILNIYHKQILMPFGEFLPLGSLFPKLYEFFPQAGNFSPGKAALPVRWIENSSNEEKEIYLGLLICYEDLVSTVSRHYALSGADILVNLTNDSWYGHSQAQKQHNLLASWRSLETRRSLVRVTTTGYSSVTNPLGQTIAAIPLFQQGITVADVPILKLKTLYLYLGDTLAWLIFFIITAKIIARHLQHSRQKQTITPPQAP